MEYTRSGDGELFTSAPCSVAGVMLLVCMGPYFNIVPSDGCRSYLQKAWLNSSPSPHIVPK